MFFRYDLRIEYVRKESEKMMYNVGKRVAEVYSGCGVEVLYTIGHDSRFSSPALKGALIDGIDAGGGRIRNLGNVDTPLIYYLANLECQEYREDYIDKMAEIMDNISKEEIQYDLLREQIGESAMIYFMITASHNDERYNGFKLLVFNRSISGNTIWKYFVKQANELSDITIGRKISQINPSSESKYEIDDHNFYEQLLKSYVRTIKRLYYDHKSDSLQKNASVLWIYGKSALNRIIKEYYKEMNEECIEINGIIYNDIQNIMLHDNRNKNHNQQYTYNRYNPATKKGIEYLIDSCKHSHISLGFSFDGDGDRLMIASAYDTQTYNTDSNNLENSRNIVLLDSQDIACIILREWVINKIHEKHINHHELSIMYDINTSPYAIDIISEVIPRDRQSFCSNGHNIIKDIMRNDKKILMAFEESGHIYIRYKIADHEFCYDDAMFVAIIFKSIVDKDRNAVSRFIEQKIIKQLPFAKKIDIDIKHVDIILKRSLIFDIRNSFVNSLHNQQMKKTYHSLLKHYNVCIDYCTDSEIRISEQNSNWWFSFRFSNTENLVRLKIEAHTKPQLNIIYHIILNKLYRLCHQLS